MEDEEEAAAWHESPGVTITRLICQLILAIAVMIGATIVFLTHPEYAVSASLLIGVVVGSWFGLVRSPGGHPPLRHKKEDH